MSYACGAVPRINYFSNPDLVYLGSALGVDPVVDPMNGQSEITLSQISPGRYETQIPLGNEGAYFLNITQADASGAG